MDTDYYNDISDLVNVNEGRKKRIIHSTIMYVLAYICTTYLYYGISGVFAKFLFSKYINPPSISYFGLSHMPVSTAEWTRNSVILVHGFPAFICLLVGIAAYSVNENLRKKNTLRKVFALWFAIHCCCLFFTYCITSSLSAGFYLSPFYFGFAVVAAWMYLDTVFLVPLSLLGVIGTIFLGYELTRAFLSLSFSRKLAINYKGRRKFLLQVAILPWLIGSAICIAISLPQHDTMRVLMINVSKNASIAFLLLGMRLKMDHIIGGLQIHSIDVFKRPYTLPLLTVLVLIFIVQWHSFLNLLHLLGLNV